MRTSLIILCYIKDDLVHGSQVYEQQNTSLCAAVWYKVKPLLKCLSTYSYLK
jgi:hypothetical protein